MKVEVAVLGFPVPNKLCESRGGLGFPVPNKLVCGYSKGTETGLLRG